MCVCQQLLIGWGALACMVYTMCYSYFIFATWQRSNHDRKVVVRVVLVRMMSRMGVVSSVIRGQRHRASYVLRWACQAHRHSMRSDTVLLCYVAAFARANALVLGRELTRVTNVNAVSRLRCALRAAVQDAVISSRSAFV